MKQIAIAGAALIALGAVAFAQSEQSGAPAGGTPPAAAEAPLASTAPEAGPPEARRHDMRENWRHDRRDMRRHMQRAGREGPGGAMFSWRTEDGGRFLFRCADRDTTQECVDAILPLIDRIDASQDGPLN